MCSEWRNIVKQDSQIRRRWREFLDERKRHFTRKGNRKVIRGSILIYKNDISLCVACFVQDLLAYWLTINNCFA